MKMMKMSSCWGHFGSSSDSSNTSSQRQTKGLKVLSSITSKHQ